MEGIPIHWAKRQRELLLGLANLRDDSCGHFRRRFRYLSIRDDDSTILSFRDQLRILWRREKVEDSFVPIHAWLEHLRMKRQQTWLVGSNSDGTYTVEPNYAILPLALALAISRWQTKMGLCENPGCQQKYFLKGRITQRFCDRELCAAYGQRQHKLKWWNEHGETWKRSRAPRSKRS